MKTLKNIATERYILALSFILIFLLAWVNGGLANDDHLAVIRWMFDKNEIPAPDACWQCYHPKFYHVAVLGIWKLFHVSSNHEQFVIAQLLCAAAIISTILICWKFIRSLSVHSNIKLFTLALIALNPRLISIAGQASNDAFIIFFGTVIIYSMYQLQKSPSRKHTLIVVITLILAGATKGNSWILFIGVIIMILIKLISSKKFSLSLQKGYSGLLLLVLSASLTATLYLGEYYNNYNKYGTPVVYNTALGEIPSFFEESVHFRPGVKSIYGAYFTFRIVDMIAHPVISTGQENYPAHRTSLWSQLYGRWNFVYFDQCPEGDWLTFSPIILNVGRIALFLGLFPMLIFLIGLVVSIQSFFRGIVSQGLAYFNKDNGWISLLFAFGFVLFIILFSLTGRDYSFMKVIYILPALIAFTAIFIQGFDFLYQRMKQNTSRKIIHYLLILLILAQVIPLVDLIAKLST